MPTQPVVKQITGSRKGSKTLGAQTAPLNEVVSECKSNRSPFGGALGGSSGHCHGAPAPSNGSAVSISSIEFGGSTPTSQGYRFVTMTVNFSHNIVLPGGAVAVSGSNPHGWLQFFDIGSHQQIGSLDSRFALLMTGFRSHGPTNHRIAQAGATSSSVQDLVLYCHPEYEQLPDPILQIRVGYWRQYGELTMKQLASTTKTIDYTAVCSVALAGS